MTDPGLLESTADIAIVGMSGRFPGAADLDAFWANLRDGVESIAFLTRQQLEASSLAPEIWQSPNFVPAVAVLDDVELFDAAFFGYTPHEAEILDPQQRLFLECAWQALEHAGYDAEREQGLIGVYGGVGLNSYMLMNLYGNEQIQESLGAAGSLQIITANDRDYLTTRVSYKLNLRGPSVNVQSACSTSLVAVHLACQGLLNYQCDMALAGGVSLRYIQNPGHIYIEGGVPSPDGHCRAFDAQSQGTIFGSGLGVVALKRLADAQTDGDTIYAVIKGSAVNNDGAQKVGYTAPSVDGQTAVIAMAHELAGVDPETISYIEAHGTGTPLGDPIELAALTQVFRAGTQKRGFCGVGSVKTNIGHSGAAAGAAGLIKTILALQHRQIPPSLHFEQPNPKIDFASSPFYVNTTLSDWAGAGGPRRAGVSSFGIGGTNAHLVLEEAPPAEESGPARPWQILTISARTAAALDAATDRLAAHLHRHPEQNFADVAYTLHVGRRSFGHRRMLVCRDRDDALAALDARDPQRLVTQARDQRDRTVVFMFSGQGAQYPGMARDLYECEPVFREAVDRCARILRPALGRDLRALLYSPDDGRRTKDDSNEESAIGDALLSSLVVRPSSQSGVDLNQTQYAQPALFVVEYALAQLWMSWGVVPQAMIGHSVGEYVAATLAGVFALEDALALVAARGRLMQRLPAGSMLSVPLPAEQIEPLLGAGLALAAINGPARCVVAGPSAAVAALERRLADQGLECRRLHTSHAFHSAMIEPMLGPFAEQVRRVALSAPSIPFISNVTGTWIADAQATDPAYWAQHARATVRFADGVGELLRDSRRILLEVGPGQTLAALARQHPARTPAHAVLASLRHPSDRQPDVAFLLGALGQLWLAGLRLDWSGLHARERRIRVALPTYPFERQRYWIDPPKPSDAPSARPGSLRRRADQADWFAIPSWRRALPPARPPRAPAARPPCWLVFGDSCGLGERIAEQLGFEGAQLVIVEAGERFGIRAEGVYTIDPRRPEDYDALFEELRALDMMPQIVAHLWNVTPERAPDAEQALDLSFYSLLLLAQALGRCDATGPLRLGIVSNGVQQVADEAQLRPEKAALLGPCRVIPQEYPQIECRSIDIVLPNPGAPQMDDLAERLIGELSAASDERVVAYRGCHRLVQTFEPARMGEAPARIPRLRESGVYLITGGLGGIGLALAEDLARTLRARLALVGRSGLPPRAEWERLASHGDDAAARRAITKLLAIEALGAEVLVVRADVADEAQMRAAVEQTRARFGAINGVIHAAGVAGGGLIQIKPLDAAARVLDPKVRGVRALDAALGDERLDFMALCSSTIALTGGIGQVDYCAANAFLDAFAHDRATRRGGLTVSVNWDAWQEVGMAANAAAARELREPPPAEPIDHPLLHRRVAETPQRTAYLADVSPATQWALAEHAILGVPTLPGAAYVEMARAAFELETGARVAELRDVFFLAPLMVAQGERKTMRLVLEPEGEGFAFRALSAAPDAGAAWQEHVRGRVGPLADATPRRYALAEILAACSDREVAAAADGEQRTDRMVSWGPRWRSLKRVHLGARAGLAVLELPDEFDADLDEFGLHPAMLDAATAVLSGVGGGERRYLPLSYQRIAVLGPLAKRIYSYVRYREDAAAGKETLSCDITLLDEDGRALVEISEFTLRRVQAAPGDGARARAQADATPSGRAAGAAVAAAEGSGREPPGGIRPAEGVEAFRRILAGARLPQIVVSTRDINRMIERAGANPSARFLDSGDAAGRAQSAHPRPEMQSAYAAPRNELERSLAEIWQMVLGIDQVGVHDNYFELGGDSVQVVQIIARCGALGLQLTPAQLFQHQTIADLAAALGAPEAPIPEVEIEAEAPHAPQPEPPAPEIEEAPAPESAPDPGGYSAEDFPEAGLDQADLERFLKSIRGRSG